MNKKLLFIGLVCTSFSVGQIAHAGDIQLRAGGSDIPGPSTLPATSAAITPPPSATPPTTPSGPMVINTQSLTLKQRVARLERILSSQGLEQMMTRMDTLQNQIENLQGDMDMQQHDMDQLKQRQRDLYMDLDRRLTRLERGASGGSAAVGTTTGVPATATATTTPTGTAATTTAPTATQTVAPASGAATSVTSSTFVDTAGEQQAYQNAFDTLRNLHYAEAVQQFKAFIAKYPKGRYAHIAQYWIAEADYAQRKFKQAIVEYQKLINNYPDSPKVAEAMLKIGYSQYELDNVPAAQTILSELVKSYPGTTESDQARNLLRKIKLNQ